MVCAGPHRVILCIISTFISTRHICTSPFELIYWVRFCETQVSDALLKNTQALSTFSLILTLVCADLIPL